MIAAYLPVAVFALFAGWISVSFMEIVSDHKAPWQVHAIAQAIFLFLAFWGMHL